MTMQIEKAPLSSIAPAFKGGQTDDKPHSQMPKSGTYSPTVESDVIMPTKLHFL